MQRENDSATLLTKTETSAMGSGPKHDSLAREAWLCYIQPLIRDGDGEGILLNGVPLKDKHVRALFRWRHEGGCPSFFLADEILTHCGLHINDFMHFCRDQELSPWARGEAPDWEREFSAS